MAYTNYFIILIFFSSLINLSPTSTASFISDQKLFALVEPQTPVLEYHNGPLLKGNLTLNLLWYGKFSPSQRSVLVDFLNSLSSTTSRGQTVSTWWQTTKAYKGGPNPSTTISVGKQILDETYSLGKRLRTRNLIALASKAVSARRGGVGVVLTSEDVAVDGFCMNRCGTHGSTRGKKGRKRTIYAWVGNAVSQCPGECAWPFHRPVYGPQTAPLVAPNGDVGVDGMVINLAAVLAGTVTNPFGNGYFQGPAGAPLESVGACAGVFGTGAYPGYPGTVRVDRATGASYNAVGISGRKYLLPAMWDPRTSTCKPPV